MAKNTISTPIKDGVMADNSTLSSNEIKKRIDTAAASILPEVSGEDEGKVLTVGSNGSWEAATVPNELPEVTGEDEGKVLTVGSDGSWEAATVPNELPAVTTADNTKILMVYNGKWVKQNNVNIGKYMFVSNWEGDPVVTGLTLDEFNTMVSTPNGIAQCGYSGPETFSPQVVLLPTGYAGTSIINFTGYEITSTGAVKYLLTLSTTGSGDSRKFICALKKFTMTADT